MLRYVGRLGGLYPPEKALAIDESRPRWLPSITPLHLQFSVFFLRGGGTACTEFVRKNYFQEDFPRSHTPFFSFFLLSSFPPFSHPLSYSTEANKGEGREESWWHSDSCCISSRKISNDFIFPFFSPYVFFLRAPNFSPQKLAMQFGTGELVELRLHGLRLLTTPSRGFGENVIPERIEMVAIMKSKQCHRFKNNMTIILMLFF